MALPRGCPRISHRRILETARPRSERHLRKTFPREGGGQVCATMLPGGGECRFASSGQAVAVSLVLSQDVAGVRGGYTQGVSVEYDAVTGLMLSLSRTDTRALVRAPAGGKTQTLEPLEPLEPLVPLTDPGGEVPWAGLDACVEPTVGGAAPYASFTALGAM